MRNAPASTLRLAGRTPALWDVRVGDAMHAGVLTCTVEAPLSEVARIMASKHVHCVVVMTETHGGRWHWGVVSDLDLVAGASVRDVEEQSAGGTAASPVVTIAPDDTLQRAAQLMTEHASTHLLVIDPGSKLPVGVLSTLDVARAVAPVADTRDPETED
jgi:CBS domain-containing protein